MSLNKSKVLRAAEKYVLQGKIPAAIEEYRKVVDADPTDLTTINTLGDLYVRAGKIQDAIHNFSRIAENYRESGFILKAIAMLKKISKLDPTNIETSMKLANLYSQQGLLVEARQQYLQVADAYARSGQTRKALEAYQKIADLDPTNTSVRIKLGEIYSREGMIEQSHEAFLMAGAEFLRKGDSEQALNANLKAIGVNPESRQALTAIATIYTERGEADRAINILCDAFEKHPGDTELLTILGRTYLEAGFMDDAERTFLSLVELDRNRYHYLLEVGRRFLQNGDLDRASEQIDGCLEVLIAKREEDKAIDFLRRILDKDINHLGSLKRLAQVFTRIREDHNLIATLNSLAEAAMRKGIDREAIDALTELARLEPDEPMHRQRLYNLGVTEVAEPGQPEVVRATGPLDYESAAFDDAFVIRQVSEAEILAGHGQVDHAVMLLKQIVTHAPENVQVHLKLKDIYLRAGKMHEAAAECIELARIHEARGESSRAGDFMAEAHQINPLAPGSGGSTNGSGQLPDRGFGISDPSSFGRDAALAGGFEVREATGGLDLSRYQTGGLADQGGFVTLPEGSSFPGFATNDPAPSINVSAEADPFAFSGPLSGGNGASAVSHDPAYKPTGELTDDAKARILRDELEGIDFYIAQGYFDIAKDTLDRLREEQGDHDEILARYRRLGVSLDEPETPAPVEFAPVEPESETAPVGMINPLPVSSNGSGSPSSHEINVMFTGDLDQVQPEPELPQDLNVDLVRAPKGGERKNIGPVIIQKDSTPLQDLMVKFNTSELLNDTAFDALKLPTGPVNVDTPPRVGTSELIDSMIAGVDETLGGFEDFGKTNKAEQTLISEPVVEETSFSASPVVIEEPAAVVETQMPVQVEEAPAVHAKPSGQELRQIFDELKESTGELKPLADFETHYSLGLAYKDMELLDEAIEQFQLAFRRAGIEDMHANYIQCCHMLGVCFKRKNMLKVAVMWFHRGLKIPGRSEDEYQALRYEIGLSYEEMGEIDKAIDSFTEVYGLDVNYREVGDKIRELQTLRG